MAAETVELVVGEEFYELLVEVEQLVVEGARVGGIAGGGAERAGDSIADFFEGGDDIEQTDFLGILGQPVTALGTWSAGHQSGLGKGDEEFGDDRLRQFSVCRDVARAEAGLALVVHLCEVADRHNSVLGGFAVLEHWYL